MTNQSKMNKVQSIANKSGSKFGIYAGETWQLKFNQWTRGNKAKAITQLKSQARVTVVLETKNAIYFTF